MRLENMSNELSDLILIVDSREKEQKRINSMRSFFEERGAVVDIGAITIKDGGQITSVDYSVEGNYKGKPVNVGFSAKSMVDFSGTIGNLSNELARGYLRFDEVGFILITGCYETTLSNDNLHATIRNLPAELHNEDNRADILNTTSMFNALSSWERSGIHCRQILYEEQFPQAVISILNFITKDNHEGICFNTKGVADPKQKAKMDFVNAHIHYGVLGVGVKTALKLWDYLIEWNYPPNIHFAASLSEEDLTEALGVKTGKALYEAYRNRHGWVDVKEAHEKVNISPPERKLPEPKGNIPDDGKECLKSPLNKSDNKIITTHNKLRDGESTYCSQMENVNRLDAGRQVAKANAEDYVGSNPTHPTLQLSQASKGKAIKDIAPETRYCVTDGTAFKYSGLPDCSRYAGLDNKLQSSSAENSKTRLDEESAKTDKINSSEKLGTPDILQSSEVSYLAYSSVETAEGTFLTPHNTTCTPSAVTPIHKEVVKSLEDAIVDRVYPKPEIDTVIMREFMSRGFKMPEIHKVLKESLKLHKYKQGGNLMIAYKGVRADEEMDVGI